MKVINHRKVKKNNNGLILSGFEGKQTVLYMRVKTF